MGLAVEKGGIAQEDLIDWRQRLYRFYNSQAFVAVLFLLVPVLLLTALKIYPVFYNIYLSFTRYELFEPPRYVGMKNYNYVFSNSVTRQSIINTLLFTIEAVPRRHGARSDDCQIAGSIDSWARLPAHLVLSSGREFSSSLGDDLALDLQSTAWLAQLPAGHAGHTSTELAE